MSQNSGRLIELLRTLPSAQQLSFRVLASLPVPDPPRGLSLIYPTSPHLPITLSLSLCYSLQMANPSSQVPTAATPEQELAALVSQVAALTKLAIDLSGLSIDNNGLWWRIMHNSLWLTST